MFNEYFIYDKVTVAENIQGRNIAVFIFVGGVSERHDILGIQWIDVRSSDNLKQGNGLPTGRRQQYLRKASSFTCISSSALVTTLTRVLAPL